MQLQKRFRFYKSGVVLSQNAHPAAPEGEVFPNYIRDFLYPVLEQFAAGRKIRYRNCVLIFRHVYDRHRPEREYRDHDNIELNTVVDAIAMFFLVDDTPLECRHYYCSASGTKERTEVYLVPRNAFADWLALENSIPGIGFLLHEEPPISREKDT